MSISGHFIYSSLAISQNPNIEKFLTKLLLKTNPSRILEIGTSHGGLTLMIRDILDNNSLTETEVLTYDVYEQTFLKHLNRNIKIKTESLFCNQYRDFVCESSKVEISKYIQQNGTTIVLCDGGNKISEFRLFAEIIKNNDIIMAHDYAPNSEYFETHMRDKIWSWHEIQDSDIQESCDKANLFPYMEEEALEVAWVCKQKRL
jgi:hypothetical protein